MYRGYDLKIRLEEDEKLQKFKTFGEENYEKNKVTIQKTLDGFLLENGSLDGSKMQKNWFPLIEADIFLSHSHQNEDLAIMLAGWLSTKGISVFIDSCIWGYSNNLLWEIDKEYCVKSDGYFNYHSRNYSTAHVHMMLSTALNMMIDKTECLFFLNTPESITTLSAIKKPKTTSPWIYSEIAMSKIIRKKTPKEHRPETKVFSKARGGEIMLEHLEVEYDMDMGHLTKIDFDMLFDNLGKKNYSNKYEALDNLYSLTSSSLL